jgi:hypothetical protein
MLISGCCNESEQQACSAFVQYDKCKTWSSTVASPSVGQCIVIDQQLVAVYKLLYVLTAECALCYVVPTYAL